MLQRSSVQHVLTLMPQYGSAGLQSDADLQGFQHKVPSMLLIAVHHCRGAGSALPERLPCQTHLGEAIQLPPNLQHGMEWSSGVPHAVKHNWNAAWLQGWQSR